MAISRLGRCCHTLSPEQKKNTRNFSETGSNSVRRLEAVEWMCGSGRQQRSSRFAKKNPRLRRRRRLRSTPKEHGAIEPVRNSSPTRTHFFTRHTHAYAVCGCCRALDVSLDIFFGTQGRTALSGLHDYTNATFYERVREAHTNSGTTTAATLFYNTLATTSSLWGWHSRRFEGNNNNTRCRHQHTQTHRTLFSTVVERDDSEDPLRTILQGKQRTT